MHVLFILGLFCRVLLIYAHADKPSEDSQIRGDPYKTLFVSRLSYEVKESDLEREFGRFGPIERVCNLPYRCLGFPAGYANSFFRSV